MSVHSTDHLKVLHLASDLHVEYKQQPGLALLPRCVQNSFKQGANTGRHHGCRQGPHLQVLSACLCLGPLSRRLCLSILADLLQVRSTNNKRLGSEEGM